MPSVEVFSLENKKVGSVDLNASVFSAPIRPDLVNQIVKAQRAGMRQGTAKTKTKGEVRGGGRKPYKQKGTGNARRGSSRSPLIPGGGTMFGPIPRSYMQRTPKKMVQGALRSVLSDRLLAERLRIVDAFSLKDHKTKPVATALHEKFEVKSVLIVDSENKNLSSAGRNIPHVQILRTSEINVLDILRHDWLFLSKQAAEDIGARLDTASSSGSERAPKRVAKAKTEKTAVKAKATGGKK